MTAFVLDIEAIADPDALRDYGDTLTACAEKREQSVDHYAATCPALARPVAVGILNADTGKSQLHFDGSPLPPPTDVEGFEDADFVAWSDERDLLEGVAAVLRRVTHLVTFAGRSYDLPLLAIRSKVRGVEAPSVVTKGCLQKPWENRPHVDLLEELTFGRATGKYPLAAYCAAFGIADPKAMGDGSEVAGMVERGETQRLLGYLQGDIASTAALLRRVCV